jgi:mono/diheme cytochrome c family protein
VLCYWRDRVPNALDLLTVAVADPAPRVRLEAVRAASFFRGADTVRALEIAGAVASDKDYYIDYCYKETMKQLVSLPEGAEANNALLQARLRVKPGATYGPTRKDLSPEENALYSLGREVYAREAHCTTCHQPDGKGIDGIYPGLAKSDWLAGDPHRAIKIVLRGLYGPMEFQGKTYGPEKGTPPMTGFAALLTDKEVAAVLTYANQSFGNNLPVVQPDEVARVRNATKDRALFYMVDEILKEHPLGR